MIGQNFSNFCTHQMVQPSWTEGDNLLHSEVERYQEVAESRKPKKISSEKMFRIYVYSALPVQKAETLER